MRAWIAVLFALTTLAGCAADDLDTDGDGVSDVEERELGTDPTDPDSVPVDRDGDGVLDPVTVEPPAPDLSFLSPVDLVCPDYVTYGDACAGFGEPTLEVTGDGTIWYSAVCCVGQSPPIWLSHDNGTTFEPLPFADGTGAVRDAFGIEGDFAIDDAGNVYFFDISAATSWFSKYEADGTHVFTKADLFPPLVDRPWVRAGAEDEVFIVYNSGTDTWFYRSEDGGLTWSYPGHSFGCNLGGFGQGAERDHLLVHACDTLWQSSDGGRTWDTGTPLDGGNDGSGPQTSAFADDAGVAYVPQIRAGEDGDALAVVAVLPDGTQVPHVLPVTGIADYPWLVAGGEGEVAVAYYGADHVTRDNETEAEWYLRIAYSRDAHQENATWTVIDGDPDPVHHGVLGRNLGDFLQIRHADNGDLAVAYARDTDGPLVNRFVRSTGMDLGHAEFLNGP